MSAQITPRTSGVWRVILPALLIALLVGSASVSDAQDKAGAADQAFDALEQLLEEKVVAIASKTSEKIAEAPATVTVITARQIRDMGARTVTDALQLIPGVETLMDTYGYVFLVLRGGRAECERVKFLIDGHSVNPPRTGQPAIFFDDLTVANIKRIEVMRGPGSALYGANALNGVINIITKAAEDVNGYEINVRGGSDGTRGAGFLFGKAWPELKISGYGEYVATDGADGLLTQDAQTVIDQAVAPYGVPAASLAPGPVDAHRRKTDVNLAVQYRDLTLRTKYLNKVNGPYIGADFSLNRDSEWKLEYFFAEGEYLKALHEKFDLLLKFSWDRVHEDYRIQGSPAGFTLPFDLDGDGDIEIFPEGRRGRLAMTFDTFSGEAQGTYRPFAQHTFIGGVAVSAIRQFDNIAESNFDRQTVAALPAGVIDRSPSFEDNRRTILAVFLQDQWKLTDRLSFTLGVRHDQYSDFGGTTNPRAAFVWQASPALAVKVLYGQAFQAPSFHEFYLQNNPLVVGSQELKPTTMQTFEIGTTYTFAEHFTGNLAYFYNQDRDVIIQRAELDPNTPATFVNANGDIVQGIELEFRANFARVQGYVNYMFRQAETQDTHEAVPFNAKHLARLGVNVALTDFLTANVQTSWHSARPREAGDLREPVKSGLLAAAAVTVRNFYHGLELFISVSNLFDHEYDDPAPINSMPADYPMPGRTWLVGVRWAWPAK